ncbi:MAG: LamG-like jellyroll fold domain-containing protein, partial [Candidatus Roizmanbacteria bacterium]
EVRKSDYQITGSMSVGAWVYRPNTNLINTIIAKDLYAQTETYGLWGGWNTPYLPRFQVGNKTVDATSAVNTPNAWHFIVGVYDGSNTYLYFDGSLNNTTSGSAATVENYAPVSIGNGYSFTGNNFYYNGSIDEPFVTTEALTAGQIFDMYNSGR